MLARNLPLIDTDNNELQSNSPDRLESITDLSDAQVIILTELEMKPLQDAKSSELLDTHKSN
jgi:hypothetical protein